MYIDTVVASGLVIVALVCVMATYIGIFIYKQVQKDIANTEKQHTHK